MMGVYSLLLGLALAASAPVWLWRMLRHGRYREGLRQRLGRVPQHLRNDGRQTVWLHAVSVGETIAAAGLVHRLQHALPHARILVSTTTPTGQRVARDLFGPDRTFFFPLDFAFAVRPYLRALQPVLVILMESELWPRLLIECERAAIPVAVVNARVSDRSLPRYLALRRLWAPLLGKVAALLAQSPQDADRWKSIGATRVHTAGNLKYDIGTPPETPLAALLRQHLGASGRLVVAGSTHPGEEELLLACARNGDFQLLLAPRHPERAQQVAALITAAGLAPVPLSQWRLAPRPLQPADVLLLDTVGELAALYALAAAAFVGGSLVPGGGHNPLEPARCGIPVVMGPHVENFRDIAATLQAAGLLRLTAPAGLCDAIHTALAGGASAHAQSFFQQHGGATGRTADALLALLPPRPTEAR